MRKLFIIPFLFFALSANAATYLGCKTLEGQACTNKNDDWIFTFHVKPSGVDMTDHIPRNKEFNIGLTAAKQYQDTNGNVVTRTLKQARNVAAKAASMSEEPDTKAMEKYMNEKIAKDLQQKKIDDEMTAKKANEHMFINPSPKNPK